MHLFNAKHAILSTCAAASLLALASAAKPKMIATPITPGQPFQPPSVSDGTKALSSTFAIFLGECGPDTPFQVEIDGDSGRGVIGVSSASTTVSLTVVENKEQGAASMEILDQIDSNFFDLNDIDSSNLVGIPFLYEGLDEAKVDILCSQAEEQIVVIFRDDGREKVEGTLSAQDTTSQRLEITNGRSNIQGALKGKGATKKNASGGRKKSNLSFDNASETGVTIRQNNGKQKGKEVGLVQMKIRGDNGMVVSKTLIVETEDAFSTTELSIELNEASVNDDGDVELEFDNMGEAGKRVKLDIRVGMTLSCDDTDDTIYDVIDMSAMIDGSAPIMTVNNAWFRQAIEANGITCDDWEPVVVSATVSDPAHQYSKVGDLEKATKARNGKMKGANRHRKLLSTPLSEEERAISDEMLQGRKPRQLSGPGGLRALSSGTHKKILVHGYCSTSNPFSMSHFTDAIAFQATSGPGQNNLSHDEFAWEIDAFADANGIHGCGIIGHSQGGAAALHLYTYYWSCLDNASTGSKLLQSVGTPYQGTNLAGTLAAIGDVFGAGCGTNSDLTEGGAASWLAGIPSWARGAVTYYTTTFTDKWWRWDYCNAAADLVLSDPDDGVVENGRGQLPGAINGGLKSGWCHTSDMRDPHQATDYNRNSQMNNNAKY